eukprot:GDKI01002034.1.p1 GENE.GDKI01002034.1~~GDKI01002034.1.p1  ORF type:complete len:111 (-),score=14.21 GDKI01002034.1:217-549(-)
MDEATITATMFFEVLPGAGAEKVKATLRGKNELARQFNCSMTYVQCSLYSVPLVPGAGKNKEKRFYLRMDSHIKNCILIQSRDCFLRTVPLQEVEGIPNDATLLGTYGSP